MHMKKNYLLLLMSFILFAAGACAQNTDSLKLAIKNSEGKEKVESINKLVSLIVDDNPEAAKTYAYQSIALAEDIGYKPGLADAYIRIGIAFDISGKYDSSIYFYEKSLSIYNDLKSARGRGSALNNLGLIYWNMADYDKALYYFFDALKDFEASKQDTYTANALNNIGLVYEDIHSYANAITYHLKAKEIYEKLNDPYLRGAVYNNLGNSYSLTNRLDSAAFYYTHAIEMQLKANDQYGLSIAYGGYASLLKQQGKINEAIQYYNKALALKDALNEVAGQSSVLLSLADIYAVKKNRPLQLDYLLKAKAIDEKNGLKKALIEVYKGLSDFYEQADLPLSYAYFKKYNEVKDSVFNESSNRQITELNTKYQTGKKELQLKEKDLLITRKNLYITAIIGFLLLGAAVGFSYYRRFRFRQEKKLQLEVIRQQDIATKAVIEAEENERKRIAGELHDGIGQMMSAAKMNLSVFETELPFVSAAQRSAFENVITLVDESCKEIRSVSHQMMPNALLKSGLASAVKEFIGKIDTRIIRVTLHTEGLNERIENNIETVLYRVIQECVNNVLKHAAATHLDISLIKDEEGIAATIEDNGKGFDMNAVEKNTGIGLKNIMSRINFLKGSIDFDSQPDRGTLVAIHIPF